MEIIDNFLSKEDFNKVQELLMGPDIGWHYNKFVAYGENKDTGPEEYNFQFTHAFYMPSDDGNYQSIRSQYFPVLFPILEKLPIKALWRIKSNLIPRQDQHVVHGYHTDTPSEDFKSTTSIFYVNTNNGHTVFADGTKVESVANRLVSFDSQKSHSGSTCTDSKSRVVININYF